MPNLNGLACCLVTSLFGLGFAAVISLPASASPARCVVAEAGRTTFDGPCDFRQFGSDGSFTITSLKSDLIAGRLVISVTIVSPGVAEVRGVTPAGINSRWGVAQRSSRDRACWLGNDFQICAY